MTDEFEPKTTTTTATTEEQEKRSPFYETTRKVMLAAIGAVAVAQEELDHFVNRLSERGELAEKDARKLAAEIKERREKIIAEHRANVETRKASATKQDLAALSARVEELTRQLEELRRTQGEQKIGE